MCKKKLLTFLLLLLPFIGINSQALSEDIPKWKLGVSGGGGLRIAKTKELKQELMDVGVDKETANSFYNKQMWTKSLNAEVYYLFKQNWGIGAKYIFANSSAKEPNVLVHGSHNGSTEHAFQNINLEERNYFNFIGPAFYAQNWINKKRTLQATGSLAIGYSHYREEDETSFTSILATGKSFGVNTEVGLEYFLNKNWALGVSLSAFQSVIKKAKLENYYGSTEIDLDPKFSASRIDLNIGIRFYK